MQVQFRQLAIAREYRGLSQTELTKKIRGLSQSNLSKFEKGMGGLSDDLIERIISELEFPKSFFEKKIFTQIQNAHYRKRSVVSSKEQGILDTKFKIIGSFIDEMSSDLEWPTTKIKSIDLELGFTEKDAATYTRKYLALDFASPILNICGAVEAAGIIIIEFDYSDKFDGVSFLTDQGTPVIIINRILSNDRKRFTIAHELGHLVMHILEDPLIADYRNKENEANAFASEFLMPQEYIKKYLNRLRLPDLQELKKYWLTSMSSIVRRAYDLECIDKNKYQYFNIELSRAGYRKNEPINVLIDYPTLFRTGINMLKFDLCYTDEEIETSFSTPFDLIQTIVQGPEKRNSGLRIA